MQNEWTEFLATYGKTPRDAMAKRGQAFASLYARSAWPLKTLAKVEGRSLSHIERYVRFGRFLLGCPDEMKEGLTERAFRDLWKRTDRHAFEFTRFAEIRALLRPSEEARTQQ